jgi:hypothetical protein
VSTFTWIPLRFCEFSLSECIASLKSAFLARRLGFSDCYALSKS